MRCAARLYLRHPRDRESLAALSPPPRRSTEESGSAPRVTHTHEHTQRERARDAPAVACFSLGHAENARRFFFCFFFRLMCRAESLVRAGEFGCGNTGWAVMIRALTWFCCSKIGEAWLREVGVLEIIRSIVLRGELVLSGVSEHVRLNRPSVYCCF